MPAGKGKFKVVVQQPSGGITFDLAEGAYAIEREALDPIGAEIVEVPAKTEDEFIAAAKDADAVIARNRRITAAVIKGLKSKIEVDEWLAGTRRIDWLRSQGYAK